MNEERATTRARLIESLRIEFRADGTAALIVNGHEVEISPDSGETRESHLGSANDSASNATHEMPLRERSGGQVGDIERDGEHKGEIYGGIPPGDDKPIWVSQFAPRPMNHFKAAAWAKEQGGTLPTRKQGNYLDSIKDEGALKTLFNRSGSFPDDCFWLLEPYTEHNYPDGAWCQTLCDGAQYGFGRNAGLSVLCVRS